MADLRAQVTISPFSDHPMAGEIRVKKIKVGTHPRDQHSKRVWFFLVWGPDDRYNRGWFLAFVPEMWEEFRLVVEGNAIALDDKIYLVQTNQGVDMFGGEVKIRATSSSEPKEDQLYQ